MLLELENFKNNLGSYSHNESPTSTRVILVRHGESTYNALGLHQGSSDQSTLTETGRYCARQTGKFLKGIELEALYSSSLRRAQQTAHEIIAEIELTRKEIIPAYYLPQLGEVDLPAWQGLKRQYVRSQLAEDYRCWKQCPHEFRMELPRHSQESQQEYFYPVLELYQRLSEFWQQILPRHLGKTLLLVGHSGTNRAAIATALGLTPDRYHAMQQSNCGISVLNFPLGCCYQGKLEAMNITTHLGTTIPQTKEKPEGLRLLLIPTAENMSPSQTKQLATTLKNVPIDFSLNSNPSQSELVESILQFHRQTVQLEVLRDDFLQVWQKAINLRNLAPKASQIKSERLITGIIIAPQAIVQYFIAQVLGMDETRLDNIQLRPGTISVIHYPESGIQPPMLQAMNISSVPEKQFSFASAVASQAAQK